MTNLTRWALPFVDPFSFPYLLFVTVTVDPHQIMRPQFSLSSRTLHGLLGWCVVLFPIAVNLADPPARPAVDADLLEGLSDLDLPPALPPGAESPAKPREPEPSPTSEPAASEVPRSSPGTPFPAPDSPETGGEDVVLLNVTLERIASLMEQIRDNLAAHDPSAETQQRQSQVVAELEALLKAAGGSGQSSPSPSDENPQNPPNQSPPPQGEQPGESPASSPGTSGSGPPKPGGSAGQPNNDGPGTSPGNASGQPADDGSTPAEGPGQTPSEPGQDPSNSESGDMPGRRGETNRADATDSAEGATDSAGTESVNAALAQMRQVLLDRVWGNLPERTRRELESGQSERTVPQYDALIEEYYRRLIEMNDKND